MISYSRILALIYRHLVPAFRDPIRLTDMLYYPFIDLLLFGFVALSAQSSDLLIKAMLCGVSCWYLVYRSSLEMVKNLLMDIWDNHLVNLFATPLTIIELVVALMVVGILQSVFTFFYSLGVIYLIFNQNIFLLLPSIWPFLPFFIMSGWILGLLISSIIIYFGKTAESLCWAVPWLFAVISGAWFPLNLFPNIIQKVAYCFPMAHIFAGVREVITESYFSYNNLFMGIILSIVYFVFAILIFNYMFNKSKRQGLSRLN